MYHSHNFSCGSFVGRLWGKRSHDLGGERGRRVYGRTDYAGGSHGEKPLQRSLFRSGMADSH